MDDNRLEELGTVGTAAIAVMMWQSFWISRPSRLWRLPPSKFVSLPTIVWIHREATNSMLSSFEKKIPPLCTCRWHYSLP